MACNRIIALANRIAIFAAKLFILYLLRQIVKGILVHFHPAKIHKLYETVENYSLKTIFLHLVVRVTPQSFQAFYAGSIMG